MCQMVDVWLRVSNFSGAPMILKQLETLHRNFIWTVFHSKVRGIRRMLREVQPKPVRERLNPEKRPKA
jgi:hypothetical protein